VRSNICELCIYQTVDYLHETAEKIRTMEIRGAAKIARAAAQSLKVVAQDSTAKTLDEFQDELNSAGRILLETRPTAVSLPNAVRFVLSFEADTLEDARRLTAERSDVFVERSLKALSEIAKIGARQIPPDSTVMTHCNSSAALAVISEAHRQGRIRMVICTESRPRWQGHLTAKELVGKGVPTTLIVDSAVRFHMKDTDMVVVGADAITAQGNVVNKIGTSQLALAADEARVPVMVAAETYKFSPRTLAGELVEIEERPTNEVWDDDLALPMGDFKISNPSFDVTPKNFIDVIITEIGAIPPTMAFYVIREHIGWRLDEYE